MTIARLSLALAALLACGCANPFAPPSCIDGVDNDRDGVSDAADPDCAGAPNSDRERTGGRADGGLDAGGDGGGPCDPATVTPGACTAQRRGAICNSTCVDLNSDPTHCGDCTIDCGAGGTCIHGRCSVCTTIGGSEVCNERCTHLEFDPAICGDDCDGTGCDADEQCERGPGGSGPRCAAAEEGSRCNRPRELALGSQMLDLVPQAVLDATRPSCVPASEPTRSSLLVRFTPATSGTLNVALAAAADHTIAAQVLTDASCRCPSLEAASCASADGTVTIHHAATAGTPVTMILVSDTMTDMVEVSVALDPL